MVPTAMPRRLLQLRGSPPALGMGVIMLSASLGGSRPSRCQALNWAANAAASWEAAALRNHGGRLPATALCCLVRRAAAATSAVVNRLCMRARRAAGSGWLSSWLADCWLPAAAAAVANAAAAGGGGSGGGSGGGRSSSGAPPPSSPSKCCTTAVGAMLPRTRALRLRYAMKKLLGSARACRSSAVPRRWWHSCHAALTSRFTLLRHRPTSARLAPPAACCRACLCARLAAAMPYFCCSCQGRPCWCLLPPLPPLFRRTPAPSSAPTTTAANPSATSAS